MTQLTRMLLSLAAAILLCLPIKAQRGSGGSSGLAPVSRTYALTNAKIVQAPGQIIDDGTILIKDGLISAVGTNVQIPGEAITIAADSMYIYAGFIDGLSHTGMGEVEAPDRASVNRPASPPNDVAGIQPERTFRSVIDPAEKSISALRQVGFTAAHVVPEGRMLPGKGAIILLSGDTPEDMILRENTSLFAQFNSARGVYPSTIMGIMAKWRDLYRQAELSKAHEQAYNANPSGMKRPQKDPVIQAFYPVIDGQQPVFFRAGHSKSVHRAMILKKDLGFPLVIAGLERGWEVADVLKSNNLPTFLSLDLPTNKDDKKKKEKEEEATELSEAEKEMQALTARRAEAYKKYHSQAGEMEKAGISFGFSIVEAKAKDIRTNLRSMIDHGLSEETALAALTTKPAEMLGLASMMGTVEQGKIANLVVTDKPYFEEESNVRYVFVDGTKYEYEVKEKKKGDPNAKVSAVGTWEFTSDIPQPGAEEGSFTIEGEGDDLSGSISIVDEELSFTSVSLEGNELTATFSVDGGGQQIEVTITGVIDGDTLDGTLIAGQFGSFSLSAEREGTPD